MRGDKEQNCLNKVKKGIFTNNGEVIIHPFSGKKYTEVNEFEFIKEKIWFVNTECSKRYFGLEEKDRDEIEKILYLVKPNKNPNDFPDFMFRNGFIEHFQVSSSKTTRKGSEHLEKINLFTNKVNKDIESLKEQYNKIPSFNQVRHQHWEMDNPEHNHKFLINCFKKNWKNHIDSLNAYEGEKNIGIFLIEYADFALSMFENVYVDWKDGMSQGDMRKSESFHFYRLSRDKVLLDFIYQYRDKVKYVIFVYLDNFEIIRIENIPYILKLLPWDYIVSALTVKNVSSLYNISSTITPIQKYDKYDTDIDITLNILSSTLNEKLDKINKVYEIMPYWVGNNNEAKWSSEGIELYASIVPVGIRIKGTMPYYLWIDWYSNLKMELTKELGYDIRESKDELRELK